MRYQKRRIQAKTLCVYVNEYDEMQKKFGNNVPEDFKPTYNAQCLSSYKKISS